MITEETIDTMDFKKRSDIHYARKLWHILGVLGMFMFYVYVPYIFSVITLSVAWVLFVTVDVLRQTRPALNDWALHAFKPIMRQNEINKLAGTTYLLTGAMFVVCIFPREIAALTLLFLAFADPIASFIGIKYGKDKIFGHKSIQGFIAAFTVCTILCFVFLATQDFMLDRIIVASLFAGLIGAFAELVPIAKLDDNLTLPVISSIGLYILFYFFGFLTNVG